MVGLQSKILELEAERRKLADSIERLGKSSKLAEERRLKLLELERDLIEHRKKLDHLKKLEKMKQASDENARRLQVELQELKTIRVRMVKQMREEGARYRLWKAKADKELAQVKQRVSNRGLRS